MKLRELYSLGKKQLMGLDFPAFDTACLCEKFFGADRQELLVHGEREPDEESQSAYLAAVEKRSKGYPLQYLLGYWYFMDMKLTLKEGVLVPREDTEVLVNKAAEFIGDRELHGMDLCSGTGAVALGIAKLCRGAKTEAAELFDAPYECLIENAEAFGVGRVFPIRLDVLSDTTERKYDYIVSNPPYVTPEELKELQPEVKNEPKEALIGGEDGLLYYRGICGNWKKNLVSGGMMAFEIGESQGAAVSEIMKENGFTNIRIHCDEAGLHRVVSGILRCSFI